VAIPAHASTSISIQGQFVENSSKQAGCAADFCGTGILLPLGKATDAGSRSTCYETFTLADGSFTTCGTVVSLSCSTMNSSHANACGELTGVEESTIVGGTGAFAGASGSLTNTFTIANPNNFPEPGPYSAIADYTGTLILP